MKIAKYKKMEMRYGETIEIFVGGLYIFSIEGTKERGKFYDYTTIPKAFFDYYEEKDIIIDNYKKFLKGVNQKLKDFNIKARASDKNEEI